MHACVCKCARSCVSLRKIARACARTCVSESEGERERRNRERNRRKERESKQTNSSGHHTTDGRSQQNTSSSTAQLTTSHSQCAHKWPGTPVGPSTDAPARQWIVASRVMTHSHHGLWNTRKEQAERGKGEEFQCCSVTLLLSLCLSFRVAMYVC